MLALGVSCDTCKSMKRVKYEVPEDNGSPGMVNDLAGIYRVSRLVQDLREGLPLQRALELKELFGLADEQLAVVLGISRATLMRLKKQRDALTQDQGDRVIRFERLFQKAYAVFDNADAVRQWFKTPAYGLNGEPPLQFAETEVGAREVETLLDRLEYGVYA